MKARIVLFYGLGGSAIEWWGNGERLLQKRFQQKGCDCLLINWDQRQEAYNYMHGFAGYRAYLGDSLGAGSAAQFPADLATPVNFAGGFQPSMDDARAAHGLISVAKNVITAHAIHDPVWLDTMGLGQAQYIKTPGATTVVMNTEHRGAHPDDWGYSQDLLFHQVMSQINGPQHS